MGWGEGVYDDLSEIRAGRLTEAEFRDKYGYRRAILSLDMTDFTLRTMLDGEMQSLLRILDAQKVCAPVLQEFNAELIRFFADDIVALFEVLLVGLSQLHHPRHVDFVEGRENGRSLLNFDQPLRQTLAEARREVVRRAPVPARCGRRLPRSQPSWCRACAPSSRSTSSALTWTRTARNRSRQRL